MREDSTDRRDEAAAKNEGFERYDEEDKFFQKQGRMAPSRRGRNISKMVCLVGTMEKG